MCYHITIDRACTHDASFTQLCGGRLAGGGCSIPEQDIEVGVDFTCINCIYNREYWSELEATVDDAAEFVTVADNISDRYHEDSNLFWEIMGFSYIDHERTTELSRADLQWLTTARVCVDLSVRDLLDHCFTVSESEEVFADYRSQFLRLRDTLRFLNEAVERGICMQGVSQALTAIVRRNQVQTRALRGGRSSRGSLVRDILPETLPSDFTGCPICGESQNLVRIACPSNHVFCRECVVEWVKGKEIATCPLDRWAFRRSEIDFPGEAFIEDDNDDDGHWTTPRWLLLLQGLGDSYTPR